MKGSWDYWVNFVNLLKIEGCWFLLGFEDKFFVKGWYELDDILYFVILKWMEDVFNEGEVYNKMLCMIFYVVLFIFFVFLLFCFIQVGFVIWKGESDCIVVSYEVEDEIDEVCEKIGD